MEVRVPASPAPRPVAVSAKSSPVMDGAITPKTPSPQIHERLDAMALAEDVATNSFDVAAGDQTYSSPSDAVTLFIQ